MAQARILAHQVKAARALARIDQQELADRSGISVPTIKRMEAGDGPIRGNYESVAAVVAVLEAAGIMAGAGLAVMKADALTMLVNRPFILTNLKVSIKL